MNKLASITLAVLATTSLTVSASPIIMEGNYVRTAVSDNGTMGFGGTVSPGIIHDASGTGNFGSDDYLTPGTPWEIFAVSSNQTGLLVNNNTGSTAITGNVNDIMGSGFDNAVNWSGEYAGWFSVSTDVFFNDGDERISFVTTLTALADMDGLSFLRAIDPDPDAANHSSHHTTNGRGNTGLAAEDWVHSQGGVTGLTLGLFSDSHVAHNTGVSSSWSMDPDTYLSGTNDGDGDYTIGIGFDIGDLASGESVSLSYHYVMGDNLDDADVPVSEPGALALFGTCLLFAGAANRRRKLK